MNKDQMLGNVRLSPDFLSASTHCSLFAG